MDSTSILGENDWLMASIQNDTERENWGRIYENTISKLDNIKNKPPFSMSNV